MASPDTTESTRHETERTETYVFDLGRDRGLQFDPRLGIGYVPGTNNYKLRIVRDASLPLAMNVVHKDPYEYPAGVQPGFIQKDMNPSGDLESIDVGDGQYTITFLKDEDRIGVCVQTTHPPSVNKFVRADDLLSEMEAYVAPQFLRDNESLIVDGNIVLKNGRRGVKHNLKYITFPDAPFWAEYPDGTPADVIDEEGDDYIKSIIDTPGFGNELPNVFAGDFVFAHEWLREGNINLLKVSVSPKPRSLVIVTDDVPSDALGEGIVHFKKTQELEAALKQEVEAKKRRNIRLEGDTGIVLNGKLGLGVRNKEGRVYLVIWREAASQMVEKRTDGRERISNGFQDGVGFLPTGAEIRSRIEGFEINNGQFKLYPQKDFDLQGKLVGVRMKVESDTEAIELSELLFIDDVLPYLESDSTL